ncbi:hypothetical protein ABT123_32245, partial [Streptomyces sp. NPDC002054]
GGSTHVTVAGDTTAAVTLPDRTDGYARGGANRLASLGGGLLRRPMAGPSGRCPALRSGQVRASASLHPERPATRA